MWFCHKWPGTGVSGAVSWGRRRNGRDTGCDVCGADLWACGTGVWSKQSEGLRVVNVFFKEHVCTSQDTCFSSITKCNCCHLVLLHFVFNTLLNEPTLLKYLRLVTLYERSKKKWEPLEAKEDSWEKLGFKNRKYLGHLLASKKVYSLLDGNRCWAVFIPICSGQEAALEVPAPPPSWGCPIGSAQSLWSQTTRSTKGSTWDCFMLQNLYFTVMVLSSWCCQDCVVQKDHPESIGDTWIFPVGRFIMFSLAACECYKYFCFCCFWFLFLCLLLLMWPTGGTGSSRKCFW